VLTSNGAAVTVSAGSTSFVFANGLTSGTAYAVAVQSSPNGQTCSVASGSGTIGTANVSNVVVTCSNQAYTIGGTVDGLNGSGLVLANGADQLPVSSGAATFTMGAPVAFSSTYQLTVATQPAGLSCSVQNGTGTMGAGMVTNIVVTCSDQPYTLGGTITGLVSTGLKLANGPDTLQIADNAATFTFPTGVAYSSSYSVTVTAQPVGMTCSVTSGSGIMPAVNVSNVAVVCSDQSYSLGGSINGLNFGGLKLTDGTDTVTVTAGATSFSFPTLVAFTSAYAVTVANQPTGQTCTPSNNSGHMGAAAVTNVVITCADLAYTLGGSINGLGPATGLVLTDGTDHQHVMAGATSFSMYTGLAYQSPYTITVETQPLAPGVNCSVTNGSGTMPANAVSSVQVNCALTWIWEAGTSIADNSGSYTGPTLVPSARNAQMSWTTSDGKFWLFGGTTADAVTNPGPPVTPTPGDIDDVWSYNPSTQVWTWVSGSQAVNAAPMYGVPNVAAATNTPGGRHAGAVWVDGTGRVWVFGGQDRATDVHNDLWTYNTTTGQWMSMDATPPAANDPGDYSTPGALRPLAREGAATWVDRNGLFWLFGGVTIDSGGNLAPLSDLWKFDPSTRLWTLVSGTSAPNANGTYPSAVGQVGAPGARGGASTWVDSLGQLWLFGGAGFDGYVSDGPGSLNDLWVYNIAGNQWTWVSGSDKDTSATGGAVASYGTQGTASTANTPGGRFGSVGWTDNSGRFWLFGGADLVAITQFNDLWSFEPTYNQWTFVKGTAGPSSAAGTYGIPQVGDPANLPGARYLSSGWTDSGGHLWLFGGSGYDDGTVVSGNLNDLWKF
jgi:hypothetical protein